MRTLVAQMLLLVSLGTPSESIGMPDSDKHTDLSQKVINNIAFLKAQVLGRTLRIGNWGGMLRFCLFTNLDLTAFDSLFGRQLYQQKPRFPPR